MPKVSTEVERGEEETPMLDGKITLEVNTTPNLRRTDDKEMNMYRCALLPDHVAVWYLKGTRVSLSALAARYWQAKG